MNQILSKEIKQIIIKGYKKPERKKNHIVFYRVLLILSIMVFVFSMSYNIYANYNRIKDEKLSEGIKNSFNVSSLYSDNNSNNIISEYENKENKFSVIGIIKIDSIKISYPILSNIDDELLKISPCKFYGPMPNEVGNLCIAAHNYDDNRFFSKIGKLKNDDIITIYDNNGYSAQYKVFNVYETSLDDVSCTSQETNNTKEITLVTCNNKNGKRIIVKARENIIKN